MRFAVIALLTILVFPNAGLSDDTFIAFWNVENLFDNVDDPTVEGDEEFTPAGPNKWTEERLAIKLTNLAKVISKMNGGKGPDVLGLAEIENRKVIELLIAKLQPLGREYKIVHKDSPSGRSTTPRSSPKLAPSFITCKLRQRVTSWKRS